MIYRLLDSEIDAMPKLFNKSKSASTEKDLVDIGVKEKPVEEEEYKPRLDLSYVFQRLRAMCSPAFVQRGKLKIYYELKDIIDLFEQDEDFMTLVEEDVMNTK